MNLRVFQKHADGSFNYNTILSDVTNQAGPGSYAWDAGVLQGSTASQPMHFEITFSSNGQSLNPFNSGIFYISNASAISTSGAPTSTATSSTSATSATAATTSSTSSPASTTSSATSGTSSASAAAATTSAAASNSSGSSDSLKLGLGLALGLGIPLLLLIGGLAGYMFSKRRRQHKALPTQTEEDMHQAATPPTYYKDEPQESQVHEVDGQHPVHEAPSEAAHEMVGERGVYELSGEREKR